MAGLPRAAGCPSTRMVPDAAGTKPRMPRIIVVLPAPFEPSTPTNTCSAMSRLTPARTVWPPSLSVTLRNSIAVMFLLLGQRLIDVSELAHDPGLIVLRLGLGLGGPHHRDLGSPGKLLH